MTDASPAVDPPTPSELGVDPDDTRGYRVALHRWLETVSDGAAVELAPAELKPRPVGRAIEGTSRRVPSR